MKQTIKITKQDCTEQLTGVPVPIVQRMVECQVEQGNPANIAVFQRNINACLHMGGFNWGDTKEGYASWYNTLMDKEFSKFMIKYLSSNNMLSPDAVTLSQMSPNLRHYLFENFKTTPEEIAKNLGIELPSNEDNKI